MPKKPRVCIIGCGPLGMSCLYHFAKLSDDERPDIVCFEKQWTWGGQWNPTWKIGTDEYGELVHSTIYPQMLINVPKEVMEYPDYSFQQHFGKSIPSYVDASTIREYLVARVKAAINVDLLRCIRFSTIVRNVEYDKIKGEFTVTVHSLPEDNTYVETGFSHVIVATGILSVPYFPLVPALDKFKGRVLHSRDFREASDFKEKNILIIGSSFSAQDIAQLTIKYGASRVICSWRTKPMGYNWPAGIQERPLVKNVDAHSALFIDGSTADIDVVIFCTGYKKHFPFLPDDLRLKGKQSAYYPDHLYKGILWMNGGNKRLLYIGVQNQAFSLALFDVQASWACKYTAGLLNIPVPKQMFQDMEHWKRKCSFINDAHDAIVFQTEYVLDLANETDYKNKFKAVSALFHEWIEQRQEDINTYRDKQFASVYTGVVSAPPEKPWITRV